MARQSQYTQPLTKSPTFRRVTGEDKSKIDEALEAAKIIKDYGQSNVETNMKILQDDNVIAMQRHKALMSNLVKFKAFDEEIYGDNYNGNLDAWALDRAREVLDQKTLSELDFRDLNKPDQTASINYPDAAYGPVLTNLKDNFKTRYKNIKNSLEDIGIPYDNLSNAQAFIDKEHQNIFSRIGNANNYNIIDGFKSLFTGQGLNYTSLDDLQSSYNFNLSKSKLSNLSKIDSEFKAFYKLSPQLAKDFESIIATADLKFDVTTSKKLIEVDTTDERGQSIKERRYEITTEFTDKFGNFSIETSSVPLDPIEQALKDASPSKKLLYESLISTDEGRELFNDKILNENYLSLQAYKHVEKTLGPKHLTNQSNANMRMLRTENMSTILEYYLEYVELFHMEDDGFGGKRVKNAVSLYESDPSKYPKPSYYKTREDIMQEMYPIKRVGLSPMEGTTNLYSLDEGLSSNMDYQDWFNSNIAQQDLADLHKGMFRTNTFKQDLVTEHKNGDYSRVTPAGIYYPPANIQGDIPMFTYDALKMMGLGDAFRQGQELRFGYDLINEKVVMTSEMPYQSITNTGKEIEKVTAKGGISSMALRAINDIPYIGGVTEFLLGDELDWSDLFMVIPYGAAAGLITKVVWTGGKKLLAPALQKTHQQLGKTLRRTNLQQRSVPGRQGARTDLQIGRDAAGAFRHSMTNNFIIGKTTAGKFYRLGAVGLIAGAEWATDPDAGKEEDELTNITTSP